MIRVLVLVFGSFLALGLRPTVVLVLDSSVDASHHTVELSPVLSFVLRASYF